MSERKDVALRYIGLGLKRDVALDLAAITRHQYYYQPTGGRSGMPPSTETQFWDGTQFLVHSNDDVVKQIKEINSDPDTDYGYKRMHGKLRFQGYRINRKKVYRLMRENDLLHEKLARVKRTYAKYRIVTPEAPLRVLEMDIKLVWVGEHKRYAFILTVLDTFTRVVLHWRVGYSMKQDQVKAAWEHVIEAHLQPRDMLKSRVDIEIRNDNGPQFLAKSVQEFFKDNYLNQVFTHPYTPQENGHVESFHAILSRALESSNFWSLAELEQKLTLFYEKYNNERIHSAILYLPPNTFWKLWDKGLVIRNVDSKKRVTFKSKVSHYKIKDETSG